MMKILPRFIVFEGLDGAGTTSQARLLDESLRKKSYASFLTREPSDGPIGHLLRSYLRKEHPITELSLALLYSADRDDHLNNDREGVLKMLKEKKIVISDRYLFSSLAYQGAALDYSFIESINRYPYPEILIYIDTPLDECMRRIEERGEDKELFEERVRLKRVRENYERAISELPEGVNLIRIEGSKGISEIAKEIESRVLSLLT